MDKAKKDLAGYYAHITALRIDMVANLIHNLKETDNGKLLINCITSYHGDLLWFRHGAYKKQPTI